MMLCGHVCLSRLLVGSNESLPLTPQRLTGDTKSDTQSIEAMIRAPSLAAGIGGTGFEWNPNPASRRPRPNPATRSNSNAESNLTFSPKASIIEHMKDPISSLSKSGSDGQSDTANQGYDPRPSESEIQQIPDEPMSDEESSEMSDQTNQGPQESSAFDFNSIQTRAPGLTPLRLTPKSAPETARSDS